MFIGLRIFWFRYNRERFEPFNSHTDLNSVNRKMKKRDDVTIHNK